MKFNNNNKTFPISYFKKYSTDKTVSEYIAYLKSFLADYNYTNYESFVALVSDKAFLEQSAVLKNKLVTARLRYILLVGIGGSNLGVKAIYDALTVTEKVNSKPTIVFIDTVYPELYENISNILKNVTSPEEILIIGISKSGTTLESIVNLDILFSFLGSKFSNIESRAVLISAKETPLYYIAKEKGILLLECPKNVSGRYSVFTSVGLFPLMCAGIDVSNLLAGAKDISEVCLTKDLTTNWCLQSAIFSLYNKEQGRDISVLFVFNPRLESLAKWYMQLVAESLGKKGTGITPYTAIGSTDLHSLEQLLIGGMKDKYFTLVNVASIYDSSKLHISGYFSDIVPLIKNRSVAAIQNAIYLSVKNTCLEKDISFVEVSLNKLSSYELGAFMQFKMIETAILGKLFNVNAFDQPDVEHYKKITKRILQKDVITQII